MRPMLAGLAFALGCAVLPALAEAPPAIRDASACRQTEFIADVTFTFDGGACDRVVNADGEPGEAGRLTLWVHTEAEAEICTMQIVPITVDEAFEVEPEITALDIEVYNPGGNLAATGSIDIAPACDEADAAP